MKNFIFFSYKHFSSGEIGLKSKKGLDIGKNLYNHGNTKVKKGMLSKIV